eukprot:TRINITY_DN1541_c0_g2_i1.p1 TRINITY_DN1541_c0_g2~~TRINITY_DN1541_c0_g2_i1.p1  ORF type:complete len:143 (-),score=36.24 TRINITY_DN1541_c0_g2_i1:89-517(-)
MGFDKLPKLVFQRFPRIPYPVKIIKSDFRKVEESVYNTLLQKEKIYKPMRCGFSFRGSHRNNTDVINSEIALELFEQVPKDFPLRTQLMLAMPGIVESTFFKFKVGGMTELQQQKEEIIKTILKQFPSLSDTFSQHNEIHLQ